MTLRLKDHWLWDFWFAQDGDDIHVFYLKAPRSIGDADQRHHRATIGHAVSTDLYAWQVLPDALGPSPTGAFDDLATWTGSVLHHGGRWHMFYTGIRGEEHGKVQRIGRATSLDLVTWEKSGPVLEADSRWYEKLHPGVREEAWRDPWVFWDEESELFHMLVTARSRRGPLDARGVIGHASSEDLSTWQVGPPLSEPGDFYHLEVPQLVHIGGAWRVLFCVAEHEHSRARRSRSAWVAETGTHYLTGQGKFGPYSLERDDFLVGDPRGRHYGGRLLKFRGDWYFFAWQQFDDAGGFVGQLSDPMPVIVEGEGSIRVPPILPRQ